MRQDGRERERERERKRDREREERDDFFSAEICLVYVQGGLWRFELRNEIGYLMRKSDPIIPSRGLSA